MSTEGELDRIGEVIGSWRLTSRIGRGGMGVVYRAAHQHLAREAAVKMLARDVAADAASLARFFDEARAASMIDHAGIVRVLDCGLHEGGLPFIVMELLRGRALSQELDERGPMTIAAAAKLGTDVADALAAAHAAGIVHRDLKPDNIFLADEGVKVLDFGIAKLLSRPQPVGDGARTASGVLMGTPRYMSPEQCRAAQSVDHRTDIYSLGCVLFEALTGRAPFPHDSYGELVAAHLAEPPPRLAVARSEVPAGLDHLVDAMLAKDASKRPQSMAEVRAGLAAYVGTNGADVAVAPTVASRSNAGPGRSPGRLLIGGAIAVAVAIVATAAAWRARSATSAVPTPEVHAASAPQVAPAPRASTTMPAAAPTPDPASHDDVARVARDKRNERSQAPRTLTIDSTPSVAVVCDKASGRAVGTTPLVVARPRRGQVSYVVQKRGHAAVTQVVSATSPERLLVPLRALGPDDLEDVVCGAPARAGHVP